MLKAGTRGLKTHSSLLVYVWRKVFLFFSPMEQTENRDSNREVEKAEVLGRWLGHFNVRTATKIREREQGFPGGPGVTDLPASAGHVGSIPGLGRVHIPRSD